MLASGPDLDRVVEPKEHHDGVGGGRGGDGCSKPGLFGAGDVTALRVRDGRARQLCLRAGNTRKML